MKDTSEWNFIYINCSEWYEDMIDHHSYAHNLSSCEIKNWKKSCLNGILIHNLCDTGAVLYQPIYQANWQLAKLQFHKCLSCVHNCDDQSYLKICCWYVISLFVLKVLWFTEKLKWLKCVCNIHCKKLLHKLHECTALVKLKILLLFCHCIFY